MIGYDKDTLLTFALAVVLEDGCWEDELLFGLEEGLELGLVLEVQEIVGCLGFWLVH